MISSKWSICLLYKRIFAVRSFRWNSLLCLIANLPEHSRWPKCLQSCDVYHNVSYLCFWRPCLHRDMGMVRSHSLQLGHHDTWRALRRPRRWISGCRRDRRSDGPLHSCVASAYDLQVANPSHEANISCGHLQHCHFVGLHWSLAPAQVFLCAATASYKKQSWSDPLQPKRSTIISAVRAYYTTIIIFDDFTDSRTLLDVFSAIEPATSIMVASSLVLGPVLKKWFGREGYVSQQRRSTPSPKRTKHTFHRINDSTTTDNIQHSQDIELGGTVTTVQVPTRITLASPWHCDAQMENGFGDGKSLAVREGEGISVQKDFSIHEEVQRSSRA